jgi:hypothetical protein
MPYIAPWLRFIYFLDWYLSMVSDRSDASYFLIEFLSLVKCGVSAYSRLTDGHGMIYFYPSILTLQNFLQGSILMKNVNFKDSTFNRLLYLDSYYIFYPVQSVSN